MIESGSYQTVKAEKDGMVFNAQREFYHLSAEDIDSVEIF